MDNSAVQDSTLSMPTVDQAENAIAPANRPPSFDAAPSSLRILLWDIDGTLIRSVRQDSFKDYTIPMLENVFGTAGRLPEMKVSGMTDLQIVGEALRDEGFTHEHIRARVHEVRESYMTAMRSFTGGRPQFYLLPGVREALRRSPFANVINQRC